MHGSPHHVAMTYTGSHKQLVLAWQAAAEASAEPAADSREAARSPSQEPSPKRQRLSPDAAQPVPAAHGPASPAQPHSLQEPADERMQDVALTAEEAGPEHLAVADAQQAPLGSGLAAGLRSQLQPQAEPDTAGQQAAAAQGSAKAGAMLAAEAGADSVPLGQLLAGQDVDEEALAMAALARIRQAKAQARPSPSAGAVHSLCCA